MSHPANWLPFDAFMHQALYDPTHGYYTAGASQIGSGLGSQGNTPTDFVTAPVLSAYFGQALAVQVRELLVATNTHEVWEFGAGTGALAAQLIRALDSTITSYNIVDVSGALKAQQLKTLEATLPQAALDKVLWHTTLPKALSGVLLGNEVLDAMPVKLLNRVSGVWHERGVVQTDGVYQFHDRPTDLRPPVDIAGSHDYLTEVHPQAAAFMRTLGESLQRGTGGAILMIDYGFTEREYYLPSRIGGTLMCHQGHKADSNPLIDVGCKDLTAHVNFTEAAVAAQDAGLHVNGFTSQGRFLLNLGLLSLLSDASIPERAAAQKLVTEHEMGELFKVLCCTTLDDFEPLGFSAGDRTHTL